MLSREEILSLPAGRELDELVKRHVMEWTKVEHGRSTEPLLAWYEEKDGVRYDVTAKAWTFNPSRDISAAWEVLEKFKTYQVTKTHQIKLPNGPEDMYRAIVQANKYVAFAITPSLAICRAALLASLLKED